MSIKKKVYFCTKLKKMKRITLLLSIILLSIISCEKDDAITPESAILPKKIVSSGEDDSSEIFISYNGSKLSEFSSTENNIARKTVITYTGDLITKIEQKRGSETYSLEEFKYDANNKLKTVFLMEYTNGNSKSKREYTHNANGSVVELNYKFVNNAYVPENRINTYTINNGNITKLYQKITSSFPDFNGGTTNLVTEYTYTYEYDSKNGPFKNVIGFNQINLDEYSSANNVIKRSSTTKETKTQNGITTETLRSNERVFSLKYDAKDYLTETKYTYQATVNNVTTDKIEIQNYFY